MNAQKTVVMDMGVIATLARHYGGALQIQQSPGFSTRVIAIFSFVDERGKSHTIKFSHIYENEVSEIQDLLTSSKEVRAA